MTRNCVRGKMTGIAVGALALLSMPIVGTSAANADEAFGAVSAVQVLGGPLGSFDISYVDPALGQYFLADRSNKAIDVLPTGTTTPTPTTLGAGQFVGFSSALGNDFAGPNGIITANNHTELWAGDGPSHQTGDTGACSTTTTGCSHVVVINIKQNKVVARVNTGGVGRADELCEDPQHNVVLIANDVSADLLLTFISTKNYTVLKQIKLDGSDKDGKYVNATNGIEQCQWNPRTNKFYLAIPEVGGSGDNSSPGAVLEINPASMKVQKVYTVDHSKCAGPQGLAIGPDRQIALGCSGVGNAPYSTAPGSVIIDALDGSTIHNLSGLNGNDEIWYNSSDNQYFYAGGNHTIYTPSPTRQPILGVVDAATGEQDQSVTSAIGSHSVAASPDEQTVVYLPVNSSSTQGQLSNLCYSVSNHTIPNSQGCILIMTPTGKDDRGVFVRREQDDDDGH